ncbi:hypothetical protein BofuT4_uP072320.1 [Botrytis cinerea T4]|uniref:Uncharacterized protein n=1 Tax=Botryotinia fuckeliana (strain T4) TaxID=999810 RepID=G2XPK9_BOTF4|nr:hypothetical protein BofuT4_uP072320.1 [Botrytis cinerea T4]
MSRNRPIHSHRRKVPAQASRGRNHQLVPGAQPPRSHLSSWSLGESTRSDNEEKGKSGSPNEYMIFEQ